MAQGVDSEYRSEKRSHENTTQNITRELFLCLTNRENDLDQTWEFSARLRHRSFDNSYGGLI